MARSPRSVRHLLKDKPALKYIELESSAQRAMLARVHQLVPENLADHCLAAQIQNQQLILHTDSPAWATRIRYLAPQLLDELRVAHPSLSNVRVKVLLTRSQPTPKPRIARRSDVAAAIIHDCAQDTKQTTLREALQRLGRSLKKS